MKMFELIQNTPVGGDCTCGYGVKLDREYTVAGFVNTVLKNYANEWGIFEVKRGSKAVGSFEYSYGNCNLTDKPDADYRDCKIKEAYASGGWSRMDYTLYIEKVENVKPDKPGNNKELGLLRFIVKTQDGEESVVVVFKNESDNTYSFVNLTNERIYSSKFVTVEEAIQNMNDQVRNGLIESYTVKGSHPELSMDAIEQIVKK